MPHLLEKDEINGVIYRIMMLEDVERVIPVVARAFCEEDSPTGNFIQDWQNFTLPYAMRMAVEGNSVLAVDEAYGTILGAFLNEDYCNSVLPEINCSKSSRGSCVQAIFMANELEEHLNTSYGIPVAAERPRGKIVHLCFLGVGPEARGRGIEKKLAEHSIRWAKSKGFTLAFAQCTGALSTHITEANPSKFIDSSFRKGCDGVSDAGRTLALWL
jgi:GNAT superfamily N-acetyltransferase